VAAASKAPAFPVWAAAEIKTNAAMSIVIAVASANVFNFFIFLLSNSSLNIDAAKRDLQFANPSHASDVRLHPF
jgi:hypothetical protein